MKAFPPLPASHQPPTAVKTPGLLSTLKIPLLALSTTLLLGGLVIAFGGKLLPQRTAQETEASEKNPPSAATKSKAPTPDKKASPTNPGLALNPQQPLVISPPEKSLPTGTSQPAPGAASGAQAAAPPAQQAPTPPQPELSLDAASGLVQQLLASSNEKDAEINRLRQALQATQQQMNESLLMAQQRSQEYNAAVTQRQVEVEQISTRAIDVARQADREFDDLEMENARLRGCITQLENENASLIDSNNRLRNEVSHLASSVNFLQVQIQILNQEITKLKEAAQPPPGGNPPPNNQPPAQPQLPTGGPRRG